MRLFFIHALVIASIIMVGVSPVCAFVSGGKTIIEICAADGTLQSVEVDAAFDPFAAPQGKSVPLQEHLEDMEQCTYCFAADHAKDTAPEGLNIKPVIMAGYLVVSGGVAIPLGDRLTLYQPRGPPVLS